MKRVFITGGLGFLGWYIKEAAKRAGADVVVYDIQAPFEKEKGVSYIQGDIRDTEKLARALKGCDTFFHIAAIADIKETQGKPAETMDVNVTGTARCLIAAKEAKVRHFIFASSVYVAGNLGSFYRVSKLASEHLCRTFAEEYGLPFTIVRYGSLYGRRATESNFIRQLCHAALKNIPFNHYGTGEEIREFINVEDAARETINIVKTDDYRGKTVLITGHQRIYLKDLFDIMNEMLGKKIKIKYLERKNHRHYKSTPYSFDTDIPIRINMKNYIDISEGIHSCFQNEYKSIDPKKV